MSDLLQLRDSSGSLFPGIEFQQNRLVLPENLDPDKLKELIRALVTVEQCSLWWWGDCLNWIKQKRGEAFAIEAASQTENPQRLLDTMVIAEAFPVRANIGWHYHREAYVLADRDLSKALEWVKRAEESGWSVPELRRQIRDERAIFKADHNVRNRHRTHHYSLNGDIKILQNHLKAITTNSPISEWTIDQIIALKADLEPVIKLVVEIERRLQELSQEN